MMRKTVPFFISVVLLFQLGCNSKLTESIDASAGGGGNSNPISNPVLTLLSLKGGEVLKGGSSSDLTFKVVDSLGFNSNKIEFSRDGGSTWTAASSSQGEDSARFPSIDSENTIFHWQVPFEADCSASSPTSDGSSYRVRVTSSGRPDAPTDVDASSSNILVDSCAPEFGVAGVTEDVTKQKTGFVKIDVSQITDKWTLGRVSKVCVKTTSSQPSLTDSCWIPVESLGFTSAQSSLTSFSIYYFVGFRSLTSNFYLWARDEAGNISTNSATSGTDMLSITRDCTVTNSCTSATLATTIQSQVDISAKASLFKPSTFPSDANANGLDQQSLVVTSKGVMVYRDASANLILFDLIGRTQLMSIAAAGSIIDGSGSAIRVKNPIRLVLDADENIILLDDEYIRKLYLNEASLRMVTLVGGSSSGGTVTQGTNSVDDTVAAASLKITYSQNLHAYGQLRVTADDAIYFDSEDPITLLGSSGYRLRKYNPTTSQVSSIRFSGTGTLGNSSLAINTLKPFGVTLPLYSKTSASVTGYVMRVCIPIASGASCSVDTVYFDSLGVSASSSSAAFPLPDNFGFIDVIESKSGRYISASAYDGTISVFNSVSKIWEVVGGQEPRRLSGESRCSSGANALSCSIWIHSFYVSSTGVIFVNDGGVVRFIEPSTGALVNFVAP